MNIISRIKSIVTLKCPRCQQGHLFAKPFELSKPLEMPKRCEVCGQLTLPEPGFYYGAMFLSYVMSGFTLLAVSLLLVFYFEWGVMSAMFAVLLVSALGYIKMLRFARSLWIHIAIPYDPQYENVQKESAEN